MDRIIGTYTPYFFALLRFVSGVLFAMHGSQKLLGVPGDKDPVELFSLMGLAGVIELVGGIMIATGLRTRVVSFVASGQMAFAYFMAHAPKESLPILNGGELTILFCFIFLYIAAHGSGILSIDAALKGNKT